MGLYETVRANDNELDKNHQKTGAVCVLTVYKKGQEDHQSVLNKESLAHLIQAKGYHRVCIDRVLEIEPYQLKGQDHKNLGWQSVVLEIQRRPGQDLPL